MLASNYSAYTLEITPSKVENLDAAIDQVAQIVDVQPRDRKRFKRLLEESKDFESLPIRTKLTDEEVARIAATRFQFPGVEVKARPYRNYPLGSTAAHAGRACPSSQSTTPEASFSMGSIISCRSGCVRPGR